MKRLTTRAVIGDREFLHIAGVEIFTSWENLTDTCTIDLPGRMRDVGGSLVSGESLFSVGQRVDVYGGWLPNERLLFSGYIARIEPGTVPRLHCEDWAWLLKRVPVSLSYESVTAKQLMADVLDRTIKDTADLAQQAALQGIGQDFVAADATVGAFRVVKATAAQVLDELRSKYKLPSFFRGDVLHIGLPYTSLPVPVNAGAFDFAASAIDPAGIIVDGGDLQYVAASDVRVRAKAIGVLDDNSRVEAEVGDPQGEQRTLFFYGVSDEAELKRRAEQELARLRYNGWRGSFVALGEPPVRVGDTVTLRDSAKWPEDRAGVYYARGVDLSIGGNGYRQTVHLGAEA